MSNWIDVKDRLPEIPPADCVYVLCQIGEIEPPVVLCYITGERGDGKFYMDFRPKITLKAGVLLSLTGNHYPNHHKQPNHEKTRHSI